jgi:hypothetical protein
LKIRGVKEGCGGVPVSLGRHEVIIYILLKCMETPRWRSEFLNSKWLIINEQRAYNKFVKCDRVTELTKLGKCFYNIRCKLENQIRKIALGVGEEIAELL